MPGESPIPTPIFRLVHVDSLVVCLARAGLHAPNHIPADGLTYRAIHRADVQHARRVRPVLRGPRGTVHDYLPFYFGPRSVMLYQLHTGWVPGYTEGQEPLVHLTSTCQAIAAAGVGFVFTDGHGLARFTTWYDDLTDLDKVDWDAVYALQWKDTPEDMDRQRPPGRRIVFGALSRGLTGSSCPDPWPRQRSERVGPFVRGRREVAVERSFADTVAGMIWADLYCADPPYVGCGLSDGSNLSFSDAAVMLYCRGEGVEAQLPRDHVFLDALAANEAAARKLASWLGLLFGGESGVVNFGSGWSAWAERSDGQVLEVAAFGYQLYKTKEGFLLGDRCIAAHR